MNRRGVLRGTAAFVGVAIGGGAMSGTGVSAPDPTGSIVAAVQAMIDEYRQIIDTPQSRDDPDAAFRVFERLRAFRGSVVANDCTVEAMSQQDLRVLRFLIAGPQSVLQALAPKLQNQYATSVRRYADRSAYTLTLLVQVSPK